MVFPILPANTLSGDFNIANSCRFEDDVAHYLTKDQSSGGNARTFTWSGWAKLADTGNSKYLFSDGTASNTSVFININSDDQIDCRAYTSGVKKWDIKSSNLFRDPSAWYHFVVRVDTTQGTANDRVRVYVNGSEITYGTQTMPDEDYDTPVNSSSGTHRISMDRDSPSAGASHCGYISQVHFVDGSSLAPSSFGEADEDSGIWKPIKYSGSYGTNGYFLEFKASAVGSGSASTIGADTSGNTNHFDSTGLATTDQCTDTPTNNFCTWNPLDNYYAKYTFAEGNCKLTTHSDDYTWNTSTIGVTSGKWYVEGKATQLGTGSDNWVFGIASYQTTNANHGLGADNFGIGYRNNGNYKTGDANTTHGASISADAIVHIALDLDNNNVYFGSGGQWADGSGNTDEANINTAVSISTLRGGIHGDTVFFAFGDWNSNAVSDPSIGEFNFGNPVHSISSGNADANGYGNFEYAVPSGYYALCTKNLSEYG